MRFLVIAITAILSVFSVLGNTNLSLNPIDDDIKYELSYLKIHNGFKEEKILNSEFLTFPKSKSFGINNGTYWIKLKVQPSTITRDLIAYIPTHNIEEIGVYQLNGDQLELKTLTGNRFIQSNNEFHYNFPYFNISQNKDKSLTYYLRVPFRKQTNFPINIKSEKDFHQHVFKVYTNNIFFYGICVIIIIFNTFLYLRTKENFIIHYTIFLTAMLLKFQLFHGLFISSIGGSGIYDLTEIVLNCFIEIGFLFFSIKYLGIDKYYPKLNRSLFILPVSMIVLYMGYLVTGNSTILLFAELVGGSIFTVVWILSFFMLGRVHLAKFYLIGFTLMVPLSIFFILGYNFGFWTVTGDMLVGKIASLLNILVLTYSIVHRLNQPKSINSVESIESPNNLISPNKISTDLGMNSAPFISLLKENEYSNKPLTARELDILDCLANGLNNKEIGEKLFISPSTVKTHVRNLYLKFDVSNKKDLQTKLSYLFF